VNNLLGLRSSIMSMKKQGDDWWRTSYTHPW
jgi:hypothetical protein